MLANYFFVDGSALRAQIRQLWKARPSFAGRRLCPVRFVKYFASEVFEEFHEGQYKRVTFYFPTGGEADIEECLILPDRKSPGEVRDIHFKFCGQKLKKSAEFAQFVESTVPAKFQDRFNKSEKGVDIEICCDGLKLASASRLERLFLLTNDDDFLPFCRTIKEFGANISIIHLSELVTANVSLLQEVDTYNVFPIEELHGMFLPVPADVTPEEAARAPADTVSADKPETGAHTAAAPSDAELKEEADNAAEVTKSETEELRRHVENAADAVKKKE